VSLACRTSGRQPARLPGETSSRHWDFAAHTAVDAYWAAALRADDGRRGEELWGLLLMDLPYGTYLPLVTRGG
jgi:hypothetical protein